jgi:hypothetical protein
MQNSTIEDILERLRKLEEELEQELDRILNEKRTLFRYTLDKGKVKFERSIRILQKHKRTGILSYLFAAPLGHIVTAPVIYSLIVPLVLLDIMVTIYQQLCFRAYGIEMVKRSRYIVVDRQHLAYLNLIEKINCMYCGYSNGLIEYLREIASRTEQYWCPVKHAQRTPDPHKRVNDFLDYGDADNYKLRFKAIRQQVKHVQKNTTSE